MSPSKVSQLANLFSSMKWVDLSPLLENGIPRWPTHPPLVINPTVTHAHDGYYCQTIFMPEHIGSHVDAPAHIHPHLMHKTIETYPAQYLFGPAVTYPLHRYDLKPGRQITADEVIRLEGEMGDKVGRDEILLLDFGWEDHARNDNMWKDYAYNAPGLHESAARLFYERGIRAAGANTMALDQSAVDGDCHKSFAHEEFFLPNDILIMEGLLNLAKLPVRSFFTAMPLKIVNGSGSPIRCVAFFE